ncbi:MAG: hypothetical protein RLZZ597_545 [Cyanobacteriota bacterium]|jgi:hypothetical protein
MALQRSGSHGDLPCPARSPLTVEVTEVTQADQTLHGLRHAPYDGMFLDYRLPD